MGTRHGAADAVRARLLGRELRPRRGAMPRRSTAHARRAADDVARASRHRKLESRTRPPASAARPFFEVAGWIVDRHALMRRAGPAPAPQRRRGGPAGRHPRRCGSSGTWATTTIPPSRRRSPPRRSRSPRAAGCARSWSAVDGVRRLHAARGARGRGRGRDRPALRDAGGARARDRRPAGRGRARGGRARASRGSWPTTKARRGALYERLGFETVWRRARVHAAPQA